MADAVNEAQVAKPEVVEEVAKKKTTVSQSIVVNINASAAKESFFQNVWVKGLGLSSMVKISIVDEGDASRVGHTRCISPVSLEEKITAFEEDFMEYTIAKGPFPAKQHRGRVVFKEIETVDAPKEEETGDKSPPQVSTKITWSAEFVPRAFLGGILKNVISKTFKDGLKAFKKFAEKEATDSK